MDKQEEGLKLLREIKHINMMIEKLQEQIDEIYTILTSTTVKPKDVNVQTSGASDPMADRMIKILEYQEDIQNYQFKLIEKKKIALSVIKQMEIESQQVVVLKYFNGMTIEQIAEHIGYTSRWAWEKVHDAEREFITIYEKTS